MTPSRIKSAVLSFGMSGQVFHAPFLTTNPGFEFYGVWERSKDIAAHKYPGVTTFRNLEDLLADENIELVIVNTPNAAHYEHAKASLKAGKHVIVEKPFVVTVTEADELIALASEKKLLLSVYQNRRYDSDYKAIREIVAKGLLGKIVEAEFHFDRYKEVLSPKVHKELPGPGTGALYDLGSHIIDQALQLFGWPQSVFGDVRIVREISSVDDYFEVLLYYPELRVRLHCSYLVREALPAYILHGTKGSYIKPKTDVQETELQEGKLPVGEHWGAEPVGLQGLLHTEIDGKIVRQETPSFQGNYQEYFDAIYAAIRHGEQSPVTAQQGRAVIAIIQAAMRSSAERQLIDVADNRY